jgi:hypothetical protein
MTVDLTDEERAALANLLRRSSATDFHCRRDRAYRERTGRGIGMLGVTLCFTGDGCSLAAKGHGMHLTGPMRQGSGGGYFSRAWALPTNMVAPEDGGSEGDFDHGSTLLINLAREP